VRGQLRSRCMQGSHEWMHGPDTEESLIPASVNTLMYVMNN
jgi:hypothetical protein